MNKEIKIGIGTAEERGTYHIRCSCGDRKLTVTRSSGGITFRS